MSRPDLIKEIKSRRLRFNPPVDATRIEQVSIDLLLGRRFTRFKEPPKYIGAVRLDPSIWGSLDIWETMEQDSFVLQPGHLVLAQTLETVSIPEHLVGLIEGRSSYARLGVSIHLTAPKIDPGFEAPITLEVTNLGSLPIELRAGIDKPAQLMLLRITTPLKPNEVYGSSPLHQFQGQTEPIPRKPGLKKSR